MSHIQIHLLDSLNNNLITTFNFCHPSMMTKSYIYSKLPIKFNNDTKLELILKAFID